MNRLLHTGKFKPPWIIAHRGCRAKYPENTLLSFQAALDAGATMIELDVRLSCDGKLVVMHDNTVDRTTDGHGQVNAHSLKELKQLDAGGWFNPVFTGQHVPELEEVLELVNGSALIDIEIKPQAYHPCHPAEAVEQRIVELVIRKKANEIVLISSFDKNILEQIASMENAPAIALISRNRAENSTLELCKRLNIFSWHPDLQILSQEQVLLMHAEDIRVFPFNVDTPQDFKRMFDMNVDGVICNDPLWAIDWLSHNKAA
jgi:glycerophosphoryl diester phosphodiesterase